MATYKSPVEIKGQIGDLVYYNLNGKPVVRRKSGFSKEGFENNPNYKRVKENSSEFGHCSKSGKAIRVALEPYLGDCEDKYLYQKFAKVMTQIKDLDTVSVKGKRRIENGLKNPEALVLLKNFPFGKYEIIGEKAISGNAMFTKNVTLTKKTNANFAELITLKPDLEKWVVDTKSQTLPIPKSNSLDFDFQFDNTELLLYFLILKKGEEILFAGFVD